VASRGRLSRLHVPSTLLSILKVSYAAQTVWIKNKHRQGRRIIKCHFVSLLCRRRIVGGANETSFKDERFLFSRQGYSRKGRTASLQQRSRQNDSYCPPGVAQKQRSTQNENGNILAKVIILFFQYNNCENDFCFCHCHLVALLESRWRSLPVWHWEIRRYAPRKR